MFCRNCGAQVKDGAQFCPKCGTRMAASHAAAPKKDPVSPKAEKNLEIKEAAWQFAELVRQFAGQLSQFIHRLTKRQLMYIGAAAAVVLVAAVLIFGTRKAAEKAPELADNVSSAAEEVEEKTVEQVEEVKETVAERSMERLTLDEQLSLFDEYLDTGDIRIDELMEGMVEQHAYEPELYLGVADIMEARGNIESTIDFLVEGYQCTQDERIKEKLMDWQARVKVGDENADKIGKALNIAEDIADDIGYGDTVEKGKNLFNTIYGYYLDTK